MRPLPFGPCTAYALETREERLPPAGDVRERPAFTRGSERSQWEEDAICPEVAGAAEAQEEDNAAADEEDPWSSGRCRSEGDCWERHCYPGAGANVLKMVGKDHQVGGHRLDRMESLWQQYRVLETVADLQNKGLPKPLLVCGSLYAGHGQVVWGSDPRQKADLTMVARGSIEMINFHGSYWHYQGHEPDCPSKRATDRSLSFNLDTDVGDRFKRRYAEAMSAVGDLRFSYRVETECSLFHRRSVASLRTGESYPNVEVLLRFAHPEESVLAPRYTTMTQDQLVRMVMAEDPEADGFVVVVGGTTDRFGDKIGEQFSFCLQRACPRRCELGEFTVDQVRSYCEDDPVRMAKKMKELTTTPLTLTKHYYEDHGETIGTPLLRWLIDRRNFRGFKILHFLHYNCRSYYRSFLEPRLQRRHDIKTGRSDDPPEGRDLTQEALKLLLNGETLPAARGQKEG